LSPQQWALPSLCAEWTVRDVVAHMVSYEEAGPVDLVGAFLRGGLVPDRVNRVRLASYRDRSPQQLVAVLRAHLRPRGLTAGFGGGIALTDCLIHHQDIRRPLGLPRQVPAERLRAALNDGTQGTDPAGSAQRTRLATRGDGPGLAARRRPGGPRPGEPLLMALAGRPDALAELAGPGMPVLGGRVGSVPSTARPSPRDSG
jgi:uncharacterized protein (TIGR03083 family)